MPKLFDIEVSADVYAANQHLATQQKRPKTDVERMIQAEQRQVLEHRFDGLWVRSGGTSDFWQAGYLFDTERGWHIDRYNAEYRIGVEIHGGQFMKKSGHSNAKGQQRDWEKLLRCVELGIELVALTSAMVTPAYIDRIVAIVNKRKSTFSQQIA